MRAGTWSACYGSNTPQGSSPRSSLRAKYLEEARVNSSSLRQTFRELVYCPKEAVLSGHLSGMGLGAVPLPCHGLEITGTPVLGSWPFASLVKP